jgi:hypothetical protein
VSSPGNGPKTDPTSVTTSSALWCTRKIGNARPLIHATRRGRNTGRTTSTTPICVNANARAATEGGARFDRCPGTPTALAGYPPYRTSNPNPTAPTSTSTTPHERRRPTPATAIPNCQAAHHTATTFTAGTSSSTTSSTGRATAATPRTRSSSRNTGISADSSR